MYALAAGVPAFGQGMADHHGGASPGKPGDPAKVSRSIEITMDDTMRFTPDTIKVKAGETIRFNITNTGKLPHEWVIGTMEHLKEHAETMRKMPGMAHHREPNMMNLEPGKSGSIVWEFGTAGTVDFACLVPGHMEAGMAGKVVVE